MRLHRFYITEKIEKGKELRVEDESLLHQWIKVFRLSSSDRVILFNGDGSDFEGYFKILSKNEAVIVIDKENKIKNQQKVEVHIFQAIIKKDNFELVVEKCTELGVSAIHPVLAERSEKKDLNLERIEKIAREASEQSGRSNIPEVFEPTDLKSAIEIFDGELFALDFDAPNISEVKFSKSKIGILIGPEGGFTENERDLFEHKDIKSFSLGSQVLRAETAAIAVSALILLK